MKFLLLTKKKKNNQIYGRRELTQNSQTCEKQNKENTHKKNNNNNHTHKTVFTWLHSMD